MADHVWTHIKIGGAIYPEGVDALIKALVYDFRGYSETPDEAVTETIRNNGCLVFSGLCSGDPEITMAVCRARRLTYSFCFDSHAEWDSGGKYWSLGMATPEEFSCSAAFHPVMYLKEIRERLADGSLAQIEIWSGEKDFPALKLIEGATDDASS